MVIYTTWSTTELQNSLWNGCHKMADDKNCERDNGSWLGKHWIYFRGGPIYSRKADDWRSCVARCAKNRMD
jgi:hypothetical protein